MAYDNNSAVNVKDIKQAALQIKAVTNDLDSRISDLEALAQSLLVITNSILTNLEENNY